MAYAVISLVIEVNSVFLHIRRLLLSMNFKRNTTAFRINALLNYSEFEYFWFCQNFLLIHHVPIVLGSLLSFRLGTLIWMAWWLMQNHTLVPTWLALFGLLGLAFIIPLSVGLLFHLIRADFLAPALKKSSDWKMPLALTTPLFGEHLINVNNSAECLFPSQVLSPFLIYLWIQQPVVRLLRTWTLETTCTY